MIPTNTAFFSQILIWLGLVCLPLFMLITFKSDTHYPSFAQTQKKQWVDSIMQHMTLKAKLGQLFMVAAYSNKDETHYTDLDNLVKNYHIGGLIFFQGGPVRQASLTNRFQRQAAIPLLIAIDGEWGLGMRLDSTISFPRQMTLGALQNDSLIYAMGAEIASQCKRMGIHINFAPVADVNSNPKNPVIGDRAFSEDKHIVARKCLQYMNGLQQNGIMANAKHFPGHGDTQTDSHYTLPIIYHNATRLDSLELYPFKYLMQRGLQSVMISHLHIPTYDNTPNTATTLSKAVVTDLLQKQLQFKGLIFTDALNMKGVSAFFKPNQINVSAFLAGNDILLFPEDVPNALIALEQALQKKQFDLAYLDAKVRKILEAKYDLGLAQYKPVELKNLVQDLNNPQAQNLQYQLFEKALTLIRNEQNLLPFRNLDSTDTFASLSFGAGAKINEFQVMLSNYAIFEHFQAEAQPQKKTLDSLFAKLAPKKYVLVGLHNLSSKQEWFGLSPQVFQWLDSLQTQTKVIVSVFGSAYTLQHLSSIKHLVCAYQDNALTRGLVPQILFGAFKPEGKLPISAGTQYKIGTGLQGANTGRIRHGLPSQVGLDGQTLALMDTLIYNAIKDTAMAGCQVVVARKGRIVWQKSYGTTFSTHHQYPKNYAVQHNTLYDIASITKIMATLPAIMYLYEKGSIQLDDKISKHLPELAKTNKKKITIRQLLAHQAGLQPYINFWQGTMQGNAWDNEKYASKKSADFYIPLAPNLFANQLLKKYLHQVAYHSKLLSKKHNDSLHKVEYSDLSFFLLKEIAEKKLSTTLDIFAKKHLFQPLNLPYTCFNPWQYFSLQQIAPTEADNYFRKQLIHGYAHDHLAAMQGGVGGHAGLFSNAHDVAVFLQTLSIKENYSSRKLFQKSTLDTFLRPQQQWQNKRALGFDKPPSKVIANQCSPDSFGHTGFTGCVAWADAQQDDLIFVFLSNRIHPNMQNRKMIDKQIRRKVHEIVYQAIIDKKTKNG